MDRIKFIQILHFSSPTISPFNNALHIHAAVTRDNFNTKMYNALLTDAFVVPVKCSSKHAQYGML